MKSTTTVKHWQSYIDNEASPDFEVELDDKRGEQGQVFIDMAAEGGEVDDVLSVIVEASSMEAEHDGDHSQATQCVHIGTLSETPLAIFKQGDRLFIRLDAGVEMTAGKLKDGTQGFWIASF